MSDWLLKVNGDKKKVVSKGDFVNFVNGTNTAIGWDGLNIKVNSLVGGAGGSVAWADISGKPALDNYNYWTAADDHTNTEAVSKEETLTFSDAGGGIGVVVSANTVTFENTDPGSTTFWKFVAHNEPILAGDIAGADAYEEVHGGNFIALIEGTNVTFDWQPSGFPKNLVINANITNVITGTGSSNEIATFTGTNTITGESSLKFDAGTNVFSIAGNIQGKSASWLDVYMDTSDGTDNKAVRIGGGGDVSYSRGSFITFYGNEHASYPGDLYLYGGSTGHIYFFDGSQKRFETNGTGVAVVGTLSAGTLTGANVTFGANPGHTHTGTSISGLSTIDVTSGIFSVSRGGTGLGTIATDRLLTGNTTGAMTAESGLTYNGSTLTVSGTVAGTTITGANVTFGSNPGHDHAGTYDLYSSWTAADEHTHTTVVGSTNTLTFADSTGMSVIVSANTVTFTNTSINTWRGIDQTPVNGEMNDSIASDWAYDHANASNPHSITPAGIGVSQAYVNGLNVDADTLDSVNSTSFLRSDTNDYLYAAIIVPTANRDEGMFGTYDSNKTQHIWSMGTAYRNHAAGTDFGNLYGLAYYHTNNGAGTMASGHQVIWCQNGTPYSALGTNIWTSGTVTWSGGSSTATNSHISDNSQAHSDYLINNGNDSSSGVITAAGLAITGGYDAYTEKDVIWITNQNDSTPSWNFATSHNLDWNVGLGSGTLEISNMNDGDTGVMIIDSTTGGTLTLPTNGGYTSDPTSIVYTSSAMIVATVLRHGATLIWGTRTTAVSPT